MNHNPQVEKRLRNGPNSIGKETSREGCIFCKIVRGEIPCFKILENDRVLSFADVNPLNTGHTLIIPKRHAENIWEIDGEDLAAIHQASLKIARAMKISLNPDGIAFIQLNGRAVNQIVLHYHLHLIPRKSSDPKLTMTEWELVPGDMNAIRKTAEKIAGAIK
ncbi:MAG: HIT family protein [Desulfobacterales bacterium]